MTSNAFSTLCSIVLPKVWAVALEFVLLAMLVVSMAALLLGEEGFVELAQTPLPKHFADSCALLFPLAVGGYAWKFKRNGDHKASDFFLNAAGFTGAMLLAKFF